MVQGFILSLLLAALPQTQQRIEQRVVINGQEVQGTTMVQNGAVQNYTCANPQQYVAVDQSSSGWACFDQATGTWFLHALPQQSATVYQQAPDYYPDTTTQYGVYGYPYYGYPYSYGWGAPFWGPGFWGPGLGFGFGFGDGHFRHFDGHGNAFHSHGAAIAPGFHGGFSGHGGFAPSFGHQGFAGRGGFAPSFGHGGGGFHGGMGAGGFHGGMGGGGFHGGMGGGGRR